jgi:hypothetical protein
MENPDIIAVLLAKREATKFSRSVHVVVGELSRRCNQALRDANSQPITVDMLAVAAMREEGLDLGDGELRQDIGRRFPWALARMLPPKAVVNDGCGAGGDGPCQARRDGSGSHCRFD